MGLWLHGSLVGPYLSLPRAFSCPSFPFYCLLFTVTVTVDREDKRQKTEVLLNVYNFPPSLFHTWWGGALQ